MSARADGDRRRRDARFATPALHHATKDPRHDTSAPDARPHRVPPSDFQYDPVARTCGCPAGRSRYRKGRNHVTHGRLGEHYQGAKRDCVPCALRARCVRPPEKTAVRQVAFFRHQVADRPTRHPWTAAMRARIDTPAERARDAQRFATVEPVCANRRHHTRLDRFTLRREAKVTAQWTRFCLVHHIEKLAHHGRAA